MRTSFLTGIFVVAALVSAAAADTAMFSFDPPAAAVATAGGTDGFRFQPNVDIEVTSLGYYDHNQDGFEGAIHPVAIYDFATRARLVRVVVDNLGTVDGLFRYAAISPLKLNAGQSYVVAGFTTPRNNHAAEIPLEDLTTDSHITYQGYRFDIDVSDVVFPTETFSTVPFFGPNLLFRTLSAGQPGDTDGNGTVDIVDLNNVRNNFGATGSPVLGDTAPLNGVVDIEDLNAVRNNFGAQPAGAVPEPSSVGMLGLSGLLALSALARRKRMP